MLRGIPSLLAIAVAACNGGSTGSSSSTGSSGSTGGSGSTSSTGGGTTAATTGSTTAAATSSGTSGSTGGSTGSSTGSSTGPDAGDAGPAGRFCKSIGGPCTGSQGDCCTDLMCRNGICAQPAPTCAGYAEPCDTNVPCCEPAGGGALLTCGTFNDAGFSLCLSPMAGAVCGSDADCAPPFTCVGSACGIPQTGGSCNSNTDPDYHTPCQVGDACIVTQTELGAIERNGSTADPCYPSGLVCVFGSSVRRYLPVSRRGATARLEPRRAAVRRHGL